MTIHIVGPDPGVPTGYAQGKPTTAAPPGTRSGGIEADSFSSEAIHSAHPPFSTGDGPGDSRLPRWRERGGGRLCLYSCHRWSIIGVGHRTSPMELQCSGSKKYSGYSEEAKMIEKSLNEMSYDEFQALIDGYIERSSRQTGEMPASVFFELLFERLAARVRQTVEVTGRIVGKELVLSLSRPESVPVQSDFRRRSADRGEIGARFVPSIGSG